ncbi:adhesion G protein-coupled receptor A3-like [Sinocyclocheilus anshuiensis]|uniref:adhesion G protein-coupled receptor A3-like n=1 Tax=Sinocyclocheilus anshuiensis TaxID=1608454 RepID=UPI0007B97A37|nr:PREDICTED: adhesion G protein-coupled receptor A3-like [Sinocyclocheilus anshuiensis]
MAGWPPWPWPCHSAQPLQLGTQDAMGTGALPDHVLDVASNMMAVEEHVLWMAQNEARACSRIVQCVERIADLALSANTNGISKVSANIALEALALRPDALMGLLCTVMQRAPLLPPVANAGHSSAASEHNTLLNFTCHTVNISGSPMGQINQVRLVTNRPMCPKTIPPHILSFLLGLK